jgi:hypothetical protein
MSTWNPKLKSTCRNPHIGSETFVGAKSFDHFEMLKQIS